MTPWIGVFSAGAATLALGSWVALAWSLRERAARVLTLQPGLFSEPELAYGPFWVALARAAALTLRAPRVHLVLSLFSLFIVLSGRTPTSMFSDEELLEQENRALVRMRQALSEAEKEKERRPR